jgi:hypothetical protein
MATRQSVIAEVQALVGRAARERDVKGIDEYVALGLRDIDRYSSRKVKVTLTGDGTDEYAIGSTWSDGFSRIERVRWVSDNDFNAPAEWLEPEQYEVEYTSAFAAQIRFATSPSSADRVVLEHTARHTLTESSSTTTLNDTEAGALARRASALLLRAAAASVSATIPAATDEDFAEPAMGNAAQQYRLLADDHDAEFDSLLGIDRKGSTGAPRFAPVLVSVPATPNRRNSSYLTHPRRGSEWRG